MNISTLCILILIGLIAGILSGTMGLGGAIILIPSMVLFLSMDQRSAQGTSLAIMLPPIGIFAVYNYYKAGHINLKYAVVIAIMFTAGAYLGSKLSLIIPVNTLKKIFSILLIMIAGKMLFSK
jgi:uncharacterized membrane protein YfcA